MPSHEVNALTFRLLFPFKSWTMTNLVSKSRLALGVSVLFLTAVLPLPASAAELSPWMGSADQAAFQLDPNTMLAVTSTNDPLQTGSLSTVENCNPVGCNKPVQTATKPSVVQSVP
jgi:hypothetical protein